MTIPLFYVDASATSNLVENVVCLSHGNYQYGVVFKYFWIVDRLRIYTHYNGDMEFRIVVLIIDANNQPQKVTVFCQTCI